MWELFFIVATQFVIEVQLKDLTHMFCFQFHLINYTKEVFYFVFSH
jgi:hypothetical protein